MIPNYKVPGYTSWNNMKQRCSNPNHISYPHYGARGIEVCECIVYFQNFLFWMGPRPDGLSLDRIDNDGDYCACKGNLRWATLSQQRNNRRPAFGWGKGVSYETGPRKWRAFLYEDKKQIYLGKYDTKEEALEIRENSVREIYGHRL